eukprot:2549153-Pyramimonas_sp.AAC.1
MGTAFGNGYGVWGDRLPNVVEGALDPEKHLQKSRHGDWPTSSFYDLPCTSGNDVWGVSTVPSTVLLQQQKSQQSGGKKVRIADDVEDDDNGTSPLWQEQYTSLSTRQAAR